MKRSEILVAILTLASIGALLGSKNVDMSDEASMMVAGIFAAILFAYSVFVYREKPADEREEHISHLAGKYSYLAGALVLTIGIIYQTVQHELSLWLPIALATMVLTKLGTIVIHNR